MLSRLLRANPKKRATIENMRLHPWTNDGYSKPPMQQPLSNINNTNRRRLSSKISCLVDTPIKGMTPGSRTRSDSRLNERPGMKPRTPSSLRTNKQPADPGTASPANPAAKRKLVMEPGSPKGSMRAVQEEPEAERPKSASAMLSKTPSKPPRPSRSKLDRCEMMGIPSPRQSGSGITSPRCIVSPEASLKKSSSYDNKNSEGAPENKFKLTPDRRTLSENMSTAKFSSHYDQVKDFKPPAFKDQGEITMVDSESHLFDGFGGSTRTIHQAQIDLDAHISELTNMLKDKEEEVLAPEPSKAESSAKTPVPEEQEAAKPSVTPTNEKTPTKPTPKKQTLQLRSSVPRTPQKDLTPTARSKAAINKTGLGAKRPLGRPTNATTQRAKSAATRDRPSSVKTRTPHSKSAADPAAPLRNRRNSDIAGSLSNLSIRSDADISVKSTDSAPRNRASARKISTAPSPAKRNPKIAAKVDCHRPPKKVNSSNNSSSSDIIKTKEKEGVKSRISSIINKPKSVSRKASDVSINSSAAPTTPRVQKRAPKNTVSFTILNTAASLNA